MHGLVARVTTTVGFSTDPGVTPNANGLPGLSRMQELVGGLIPYALLAAVAGLVIGAIMWGVGSSSANPSAASRGKSTVLISLVVAVLAVASNQIIGWFAGVGQTLV